jgi:hypothetical protein
MEFFMSESLKGAGSVVSQEVATTESFFEKNPKATAIGSAIAAVLVVLAVIHFFHVVV